MSMRMLLPCIVLATIALPATAAPPAPSAPATPAAAEADARINALFAAWDANKDHQLSPAEFKAGWTALQQAAALEAALHRQFEAMDADHNGALDAAEYANLYLVKQAGKAAPPLSAFDANKDQKLEFGEYVALVRKLGTQPAGKTP